MKKEYVKPEIVFESFKMSTSIAGPCVFDHNATDRSSCSVDVGGFTLFSSEGTCEVIGNESEVCYHVPTDDFRTFTS